jgi:hypothetical protein
MVAPPWRRDIPQAAHTLHNKSMLLKLEYLIFITSYLLFKGTAHCWHAVSVFAGSCKYQQYFCSMKCKQRTRTYWVLCTWSVMPMEITFMDNGWNIFVLDEFIEQMNSYVQIYTCEFIFWMSSCEIHIGFWFLPWARQLSFLGYLRESSSKYATNDSTLTRQNHYLL